MHHQRPFRTAAFALGFFLLAGAPGAMSKTLSVGPGEQFKQPSEAITAAADGDTIEVAPGEYLDCAIISRNHLTIVGTGPGVIVTDKTCAGKALFVTDGDDITFRNLTLTRARVIDGNGAGIRAEGGDLTVENVQFIDNQTGLLAGDQSRSKIRILDSVFKQNGRCETSCIASLSVGHIALLHVERSKIIETRRAHQISSGALRTELIKDDIEDGRWGSSGYLVDIPNGGALVIQESTFQKGLLSSNLGAAVMIGDVDRSQPTDLAIAHNRFVNDTGIDTIFIKNWSEAEASLDRNTFKGDDVVPTSADGYFKHWIHHTVAAIESGIFEFSLRLRGVMQTIKIPRFYSNSPALVAQFARRHSRSSVASPFGRQGERRQLIRQF